MCIQRHIVGDVFLIFLHLDYVSPRIDTPFYCFVITHRGRRARQNSIFYGARPSCGDAEHYKMGKIQNT